MSDEDLQAKIAALQLDLEHAWPAEVAGIVACAVFLLGLLVGSLLQ